MQASGPDHFRRTGLSGEAAMPTHREMDDVQVRRNRPLLFVSPYLLMPPSMHKHEARPGGPAVWFKQLASADLRVEMERPRVEGPWLRAEHPWEARGLSGYFSVIRDGGLFRAWYEAMPPRRRGSVLCYAESDDAYSWRKPLLSRVPWGRRRRTNIVFPPDGRVFAESTVFQDPPDREHPYKLVCTGHAPDGEHCVAGAVSPDGLDWRPLAEPLIPALISDTQNVVARDEATGRYVGFFRSRYARRRAVSTAETDDFTRWPRPRTILALPSARRELYTNAYCIYPYNPELHFLFPALYDRPTDGFSLACFASLDRQVWERIAEVLVEPRDVAGGPDGMVCAGVGLAPLDRGRRIGLPLHHTPRLHDHYLPPKSPEPGYYWLTWERDRLAGVVTEDEAVFGTLPLRMPAGRLKVNARTHATGGLRIGLWGSDGFPVPGYGPEDCELMRGDLPGRIVSWGGRRELPRDESLRLEVRLSRGKLFALQVA